MPITSLVSSSSEADNNVLSQVDRVTAFFLNISPEYLPKTHDRCLLTSNLQKAIRRGLINTALGTATKLLIVDQVEILELVSSQERSNHIRSGETGK